MTELWLVDLEAAAPALEAIEQVSPRLSADDRARASRPIDPRERQHRSAAYIALRVLLERMHGPHARGHALVRGAAGKPRLSTGSATFSLSHIEGLALIGVAAGGALGVDLERVRPIMMSAHRREQILAVANGLAGTPVADPGNDHTLLRCWCRLEAFAKAHGQGLSHVLEEIGVRGRGGRSPAPADVAAAARALAHKTGLQVADVRVPQDLFAAVATSGAAPPLRARRFPCDARLIEKLAAAAGAANR